MFFILVFIGDQAISFDVKTTLSMLEPGTVKVTNLEILYLFRIQH